MAAPLVSVLIPCFNAAPWLAETLRSALAQTWRPLEVIVVDDGSTDGTLTVAKSFSAPELRIVSQPNAGQSASENRAFEESRGAYLEFLDADDLLAPDKIERQVHMLESSESGCVASCEWARFYRSPDDAMFEADALWRDWDPVSWLVEAWSGHLMMHGAAWLIPRSVAQKAGPWDERLSLINDFDFFSRVAVASSGIRFCGGARTYYRSGTQGTLSGAKSRTAWQSALLSLELGAATLLKAEDSPRTRAACAAIFQRFAYEVFAQQQDLADAAQARASGFGGAKISPAGGPLYQLLSRVLGWQSATRVRQRVYELGYGRAAIGWRLSRAVKQWRHRAS